eukprot:6172707-Pleurochrysis_carterae.AAC.3
MSLSCSGRLREGLPGEVPAQRRGLRDEGAQAPHRALVSTASEAAGATGACACARRGGRGAQQAAHLTALLPLCSTPTPTPRNCVRSWTRRLWSVTARWPTSRRS